MSWGVLGDLPLPLGLGLLRLATEGRPPEAHAVTVIHRALDHGVRVLDTADGYGTSARDRHYGDRLVRRALESWAGDASEVRVIAKVGMTRPRGQWKPNGREENLRKGVEGSLRALGVDQLFLLLLHVKDYACPFDESLATLAALQREGKVAHLGLCNVGVAELRQAQRHFEVAALQHELSVMSRKTATSGLVHLAAQLGIPFLAHRPLGGHARVSKLLKNRAMKPLVDKYGCTPHQAALATLLDLKPRVLPLVGARRVASVDESVAATRLVLDREDRQRRAKISFEPTPEALRSIEPVVVPGDLPALAPGAGPGEAPEVVVVMGIQGAGKSTHVDAYTAAGYARLNRDLLGGKLDDLVPRLETLLKRGQKRVVLDNTYPSRASRFAVIQASLRAGVPVRCVHKATPPHEAAANVVHRILDRYGRLLSPLELVELGKRDPNLPPPNALARYSATFEPPSLDEGFSVIDELPFERRPPPAGFVHKGLLLDVDGTLRTTRSGAVYPTDPEDVVLLPNRREVLQRWIDDGYLLFFVSNQSGVSSGRVKNSQVQACFLRTVELLGLPVAEIRYCPHPAFPMSCFCRKPMPGFGVDLQRRYGLDPAHLVMVGDMDSDADFARAVGARYVDADAFFAAPG